ncbi:MAG: hypothetical protein LPK38_01930, partial [Actinomycetes bacterium]|nr:hypothetical protein [Actinomycetes bacterium]MDX5380071.1 hypothetical protein [Actinomycetes bacterium]MDX5398643.1 hypothetical protein [Actinomycetes bacterium]MDX5449784.1 hypothetical protein [Actinomycetes bacterium]
GGCATLVHLGDGRRVVELADEVAAIARREGFASYRAISGYYRGVGLALSGTSRGVPEAMEDGISGWLALGTEAFVGWFRSIQAEQLVAAGEFDRAAEVIRDVEQSWLPREERVAEQTLPIATAALQRARGDDAAAEATLRAAIPVTERFGFRGALLRQSTALARLLLDRGSAAEACAVLDPVLASFGAEPDSRYLREARDVLRRARCPEQP